MSTCQQINYPPMLQILILGIWRSSKYPFVVANTHSYVICLSVYGADYLRLAAGLAWFVRISACLLNMIKINFAITWINLSPASWDPTIAMLGSRLDRLKI